MSDNKHQSLASLIECPVCLSSFEDPRMLTCLHTLCHKCLDDHMKQNGKDGQFLCPVCRETLQLSTDGADAFPKNFFMNNCMEVHASAAGKTADTRDKGEDAKSCANSEEGDECSKPDHFCSDCCEYLCKNCSRVHRRSRLSRHHDLIAVEELTEEMITEAMSKPEVPRCQVHLEEKLKLYCDTCKAAVCSICCHTIHKPHDIHEIGKVDNKIKSELETAMASLETMIDETNQQTTNVDQLRQSLQSNSSFARAKCKGLFEKMTKKLEQQAAQVNDKITKVDKEGGAQVQVQNKNLTLHLQLLDSLRSFLHHLLHKGSVFNRLASLPDIRERLQHLQSPSQSSAQLAPGINVPSASALIVDSVGGLVLEEEVMLGDGNGGVKITMKCCAIPDRIDQPQPPELSCVEEEIPVMTDDGTTQEISSQPPELSCLEEGIPELSCLEEGIPELSCLEEEIPVMTDDWTAQEISQPADWICAEEEIPVTIAEETTQEISSQPAEWICAEEEIPVTIAEGTTQEISSQPADWICAEEGIPGQEPTGWY